MPLRTRLTISYISFFAVALIILDIGLYLIVREALLRSVDNELRLAAQLIQQDFEASSETLQSYFGDGMTLALPQVTEFEATNLFVLVYSPQREAGRVLLHRIASSNNLVPRLETALRVDPALFVPVLAGTPSVQTVKISQVRVRAWLAPLKFRQQVVGVVQIARPMREIDQALSLLSYALIGGGVIVLLAAARGGAWLTRAAFRPIEEISHTAQSIVRAEDLSRRVPLPAAQDELLHLTVTINELLGRMDALFSAQQRFVADVSHELRTPLAAMRGNLEVLDRGAARDPALLAESLDDMRREVNRLIRMVNDLLLLAQSDAGVQLRHEPVELDTLLLETHRELRPLANGVQLRLGAEDQLMVCGDRDRIKQALLNLGVNALQHTPPGGTVTLGLDCADGFARLSVADTGVGIDGNDLARIFDRFYRTDQARNRRSGGAGLGLAIVKWIAEAHGGHVTVESEPGKGSTFRLLLPLEQSLAEQLA